MNKNRVNADEENYRVYMNFTAVFYFAVNVYCKVWYCTCICMRAV